MLRRSAGVVWAGAVAVAMLIGVGGALVVRAVEPGVLQWLAIAGTLTLLYGGGLVIGWLRDA